MWESKMRWCKEEEWAAEQVKEEPKAAEGLEENEMVSGVE